MGCCSSPRKNAIGVAILHLVTSIALVSLTSYLLTMDSHDLQIKLDKCWEKLTSQKKVLVLHKAQADSPFTSTERLGRHAAFTESPIVITDAHGKTTKSFLNGDETITENSTKAGSSSTISNDVLNTVESTTNNGSDTNVRLNNGSGSKKLVLTSEELINVTRFNQVNADASNRTSNISSGHTNGRFTFSAEIIDDNDLMINETMATIFAGNHTASVTEENDVASRSNMTSNFSEDSENSEDGFTSSHMGHAESLVSGNPETTEVEPRNTTATIPFYFKQPNGSNSRAEQLWQELLTGLRVLAVLLYSFYSLVVAVLLLIAVLANYHILMLPWLVMQWISILAAVGGIALLTWRLLVAGALGSSWWLVGVAVAGLFLLVLCLVLVMEAFSTTPRSCEDSGSDMEMDVIHRHLWNTADV